MGAFIAKMLLPTVSSLVFLPAASVATKRGFYMEAMVYFFTMFFTAVRGVLKTGPLTLLCVSVEVRETARDATLHVFGNVSD